MSQINVTKLNAYGVTGTTDSEASVPKVVMYAILEPGSGSSGDTSAQAHVYAQKITRN